MQKQQKKFASRNSQPSGAGVLVTGGAGFIGSNLCRKLLGEGYTVYAADNFITGRRENLTELLKNDRFHFSFVDVTTPKFRKMFHTTPLSHIYHLACPTGVPNIALLGREMLLACSLGTMNVLELAKTHRAKILFTSSCEVYGDPQVSPQTEAYTGNVDPIGPRSAYEEGKRFAEALIMTHARQFDLDAKVVRLFNVYGPGMSDRDQRVLPQFLNAIKAGEPLPIFGDGNQTRTFVFIDDLVHALMTTMEKGERLNAYNIGSDQPVTMNTLAELLSRLVNGKGETTHKPHFTEDHAGRNPSIAKIKALGWKPGVRLEDGLRIMMQSWGIGGPLAGQEVVGTEPQPIWSPVEA